MWKFIKLSGAQDKEDGTIIRPVGGVERVRTPVYPALTADSYSRPGRDSLSHSPRDRRSLLDPSESHRHPLYHQVGRSVRSQLSNRVDQDFNLSQKCFDVSIEVDDLMKSKGAQLLQSFEGEAGREIVKLEDKIGELAYFARDLTQKREFLDSFS